MLVVRVNFFFFVFRTQPAVGTIALTTAKSRPTDNGRRAVRPPRATLRDPEKPQSDIKCTCPRDLPGEGGSEVTQCPVVENEIHGERSHDSARARA